MRGVLPVGAIRAAELRRGVEDSIKKKDHSALGKQVTGGIAKSAVMIRVADQMTNQRQNEEESDYFQRKLTACFFLLGTGETPAGFALGGMSWDGVD